MRHKYFVAIICADDVTLDLVIGRKGLSTAWASLVTRNDLKSLQISENDEDLRQKGLNQAQRFHAFHQLLQTSRASLFE